MTSTNYDKVVNQCLVDVVELAQLLHHPFIDCVVQLFGHLKLLAYFCLIRILYVLIRESQDLISQRWITGSVSATNFFFFLIVRWSKV